MNRYSLIISLLTLISSDDINKNNKEGAEMQFIFYAFWKNNWDFKKLHEENYIHQLKKIQFSNELYSYLENNFPQQYYKLFSVHSIHMDHFKHPSYRGYSMHFMDEFEPIWLLNSLPRRLTSNHAELNSDYSRFIKMLNTRKQGTALIKFIWQDKVLDTYNAQAEKETDEIIQLIEKRKKKK